MDMTFNLKSYRVGLFSGRAARRAGEPMPYKASDCESYQIGLGDGYFQKAR